jgi:DNA gyrase subunit B
MDQPVPEESQYNAANILLMPDLEAVRARPGMYIGDPHDGQHRLILEAIGCGFADHPTDPVSAISLFIRSDGAYEITCEPGAIPIERDMDGLHYAEKIFTVLHAHHSPFTLRGLGYAAINFLSERLTVTLLRDGAQYQQHFERGVQTPPTISKYQGLSADRIIFTPDPDIFPAYNEETSHKIEAHLKQLAYLYPGMRVTFEDQHTNQSWSRCCPDGFAALLREECMQPIFPEPLSIKGKELGVEVSIDLQWEPINQEKTERSYCNSHQTRDGGTHLTGFRTGLTKVLSSLFRSKTTPAGDQLRVGLSAIVQVKMVMPQYGGSTREKLVSLDARKVVERIVCCELPALLQKNPDALLAHLQRHSRAKKRARRNYSKTSAPRTKLAPLGGIALGSSSRVPQRLRQRHYDDWRRAAQRRYSPRW